MSSPTRACLAPVLAGVLLALVAAVPAAADEQEEEAPPERPIATDRPTDSASPELVPRHTLQIETGYKFTRLDSESGRADTDELPDLLVRYGVSEGVEVRLTATGWTFRSGSAPDEEGLNDASLGTKIALTEWDEERSRMSLLADLSLPVGDAGFTDDYVIPKVLLLADHALSERLGLTWNLGPSFVTAKKDGERRSHVALNYAVALSGGVGGPFSLFGEVFGKFAFGRGRSDVHTLQAGTTVRLSRTVQIDLRAGYGLVDEAPDWLAGVGLAFRLPR